MTLGAHSGRALFANFGAEENDALPSTAPLPLFAHLALQWGRALHIAAGLAPAGRFDADGFVAWLNTPLAQRAADARGLKLFGSEIDVVKEVHDKGFCARVVAASGLLPVALEHCIHVVEPADLTPEGTKRFAGLVAKPRFSTSGRGRVQIPAGGLSARTCEKLKLRGGVVVEPWLDRQIDWSTQWWIDDAGVRWLGTTRALQQQTGVWRGAEMVVNVDGEVTSGHRFERRLVELSQPVVAAAAARGLRGPCGVDLFSFLPRGQGPHDPPSATRLRVCELNARFTAGFVAVMLAHDAVKRSGRTGRASRVTWWLGAEPEIGAAPPAEDPADDGTA